MSPTLSIQWQSSLLFCSEAQVMIKSSFSIASKWRSVKTVLCQTMLWPCKSLLLLNIRIFCKKNTTIEPCLFSFLFFLHLWQEINENLKSFPSFHCIACFPAAWLPLPGEEVVIADKTFFLNIWKYFMTQKWSSSSLFRKESTCLWGASHRKGCWSFLSGCSRRSPHNLFVQPLPQEGPICSPWSQPLESKFTWW